MKQEYSNYALAIMISKVIEPNSQDEESIPLDSGYLEFKWWWTIGEEINEFDQKEPDTIRLGEVFLMGEKLSEIRVKNIEYHLMMINL